MIANARTSEPSFDEYVRLLRRLHALIAEGKGDSVEADSVRDEMDGPWYRLSQPEIKRVRSLAADLHSLTGPETYDPQDQSNPVLESELKSAWQTDDYDRVLSLLRRPAPFLKADEIAFMRAHCRAQMGDLETALLFYRRAVELAPNDEQYMVMLMLTLLGLGRISEARTWAERIAGSSNVSLPIILLRAAAVLFSATDSLSREEKRSAAIRVVELITRAFDIAQKGPVASGLSDSDFCRYYLILGMCCDELGRSADASEACAKALRYDPNNRLAHELQAALLTGAPSNGRNRLQHALQSEAAAIATGNGHPDRLDRFFAASA